MCISVISFRLADQLASHFDVMYTPKKEEKKVIKHGCDKCSIVTNS